MSWLLRDGEVLAALEVADSRRARRRGLLGRDGFEGALLLRPARAVHTVGMRFPIDVAYCDGDFRVLETVCMARGRLGMPRVRARCVIEAESGAFERWGLRPGDQLEVKG
ncbi:MAG TPA: DUF192 domain-containing protein [Acidimicrobiales bacterium]|jgi:hypothetical protein